MRKSYPILLLVILAVLIGYYTMTHFTMGSTTSTTTNIITTGSLDMNLFNLALDEEDNIIELDKVITDVMPGDVYSQMPFVENTGEEDFYARVNLQVEIIDSDGMELSNLLSFDIDEHKWIQDSDGWYRYREIIKSGDVVDTPLFTKVSFAEAMDNRYIGATITLKLEAQSVQSAHNEQEDVLLVQGWPGGGNE